MFGLEGMGVVIGFALTLLCTLLCITYGIKNWNRGYMDESEDQQKQVWSEEEQRLEENL